ncbi:hypothetical protein Leryth_019638 [Lithospermum erythrorhizon]|nr:hypothetical protein Leryth_019638 [Lithospermum erythrorhizon]
MSTCQQVASKQLDGYQCSLREPQEQSMKYKPPTLIRCIGGATRQKRFHGHFNLTNEKKLTEDLLKQWHYQEEQSRFSNPHGVAPSIQSINN